MEPTYTVLGGDGQQYGPITAEQFVAWAREGRVNGNTQVRPSDSPAWVAASTVPALGGSATPVATAVSAGATPGAFAPDASAEINAAVDRRIKSGSSWFYWIAALSVVNSVVALTGSNWRFIIGLGITQFFDGLAAQFGGAARAVALLFNFVIAGMFVLFGVFAGKRHAWAFIVGMILLGLDGVLTALFQDWLSFAFHGFALYVIFKSYQFLRSAA